MAKFSEKDLQKMATFTGVDGDAARQVLALSYYDISDEELLKKSVDGLKYQAIARYWGNKYQTRELGNMNDSVEYDAGDDYREKYVKVFISSCFLPDRIIETNINNSKSWNNSFLNLLRKRNMTIDDYYRDVLSKDILHVPEQEEMGDNKNISININREKKTARGRHKKQLGNRGEFGDVVIDFERCDNPGFIFSEVILNESVPTKYFPSVEQGLRKALKENNLPGYPLVGLKATLVDGSYHNTDSNEEAFEKAAILAFESYLSLIE